MKIFEILILIFIFLPVAFIVFAFLEELIDSL